MNLLYCTVQYFTSTRSTVRLYSTAMSYRKGWLHGYIHTAAYSVYDYLVVQVLLHKRKVALAVRHTSIHTSMYYQ